MEIVQIVSSTTKIKESHLPNCLERLCHSVAKNGPKERQNVYLFFIFWLYSRYSARQQPPPPSRRTCYTLAGLHLISSSPRGSFTQRDFIRDELILSAIFYTHVTRGPKDSLN